MTRPIVLGIVGDSGSARATITRGIVRVLGADQVTHLCTDDYHRYDRRQRAAREITPLHPESNYLDILTQHLALLRDGQPVLKPVYNHADGSFGPPAYVAPARIILAEGLLAFHTAELREMFDVRVYTEMPEELRRRWKLERDISTRGYTPTEVLAELDRREPDSEAFVRPQREYADIVVAFQPGRGNRERLDAKVTVRDSLTHLDLSGVLADGEHDGLIVTQRPEAQELLVPGWISSGRGDFDRAAQLEEVLWGKLRVAGQLRHHALGEFTTGTELHRSNSVAIVQLLILYHALSARRVVALEADPSLDDEPGRLAEVSSEAPVAT
jgi:phosphoribulokinase